MKRDVRSYNRNETSLILGAEIPHGNFFLIVMIKLVKVQRHSLSVILDELNAHVLFLKFFGAEWGAHPPPSDHPSFRCLSSPKVIAVELCRVVLVDDDWRCHDPGILNSLLLAPVDIRSRAHFGGLPIPLQVSLWL